MGSLLGVRKGAWIEEEDLLLRKCIQKYGEGRWHQVPLRAGLNRCRKSCRLRWLNYLRPNIKRGEFTTDEVDLIIRLHKLLGNRWSLIAGRLPGRTANDVKNYWHTHLHKKNPSCGKKTTIANAEKAWSTNVIKPQPRTFSKTSPWLKGVAKTIETTQSEEDSLIEKPTWISPEENTVAWWEAMLAENDGIQCCINESGSVLSGSALGHEQVQHRVPPIKVGDPSEEEQNHWDEFCFDVNFWTWVAS